jgi:hypothetical protein
MCACCLRVRLCACVLCALVLVPLRAAHVPSFPEPQAGPGRPACAVGSADGQGLRPQRGKRGPRAPLGSAAGPAAAPPARTTARRRPPARQTRRARGAPAAGRRLARRGAGSHRGAFVRQGFSSVVTRRAAASVSGEGRLLKASEHDTLQQRKRSPAASALRRSSSVAPRVQKRSPAPAASPAPFSPAFASAAESARSKAAAPPPPGASAGGPPHPRRSPMARRASCASACAREVWDRSYLRRSQARERRGPQQGWFTVCYRSGWVELAISGHPNYGVTDNPGSHLASPLTRSDRSRGVRRHTGPASGPQLPSSCA